MGSDINVMSFLKIAQQFFVCEYFLLIPIDVPSFKLIEGQIKELQGVVSNTPPPWAENDQKSPGRIGLRKILNTQLTFFLIFTSKIIIDLRFTTRAVFLFFCFSGLSIPPKMSVLEIKTTFFVFNFR